MMFRLSDKKRMKMKNKKKIFLVNIKYINSNLLHFFDQFLQFNVFIISLKSCRSIAVSREMHLVVIVLSAINNLNSIKSH